MDLTPFLRADNTFTLLMAPPAWGKTRLIHELLAQEKACWLFLSPLRALAEEFHAGVGEEQKIVMRSQSDWNDLQLQSGQTVIVTTPECLSAKAIDLLATVKKLYVIVDEFHLFYFWGHDFRPCMWEKLIDLATLKCSMLALTATMSDELLSRYREEFLLGFEQLVEINVGNREFFRPPERIHFFGRFGRRALIRRFFFELNRSDKTIIFFCRYRDEVKQWVKHCRQKNIVALGCVGGEVPAFLSAMERRRPQVIFATTTLGHGVNLPPCEHVFISYSLESVDYWLQMATRAGRRGESFQVYGLNPHFLSRTDRLLSLLRVAIKDVFVRLHLWFGML